MNKHRARKVQAGQYVYRDHDIHIMEDGHWNIKHISTDFWCDGANTLADAKLIINRWIDRE